MKPVLFQISRRSTLGMLGGIALLPFCGNAQSKANLLPSAFKQGSEHKIIAVIDGDTVKLETGQEVRLLGIQAPKLSLGRRNFPAWPLSEEAKQACETLCLGRKIYLFYGQTREDRNNRILAHLQRDDGLWVQDELLRQGLARVYTFPDNRLGAAALYDAEIAARIQGRGIWSHPFYAIRQATDVMTLLDLTDTFQLIEGTIAKAEQVKNNIYLNFGSDWRNDFTLQISQQDWKSFQQQRFDLFNLTHRNIRSRGWLRTRNGPLIEVTHPEQLELL